MAVRATTASVLITILVHGTSQAFPAKIDSPDTNLEMVTLTIKENLQIWQRILVPCKNYALLKMPRDFDIFFTGFFQEVRILLA